MFCIRRARLQVTGEADDEKGRKREQTRGRYAYLAFYKMSNASLGHDRYRH
jgi:hypothetical protein